MPLYIKDDQAEVLASRLQAALKLPAKTAAVCFALEQELKWQNASLPLSERLSKVREMAAAFGLNPAGRRRG